MRKLATIQKVGKVEPIPNADMIEKISVLGWQVVCKKDEVKEGDLIIYSEIDSVMPDLPVFEFLKKMTNDTMRIRTQRMRGQCSQGICFPISFVEHFGLLPEDMEVGMDVTEALGITKYEEELPKDLLGTAKGYMPSGIRKSDIFRVQTMQDVLDKYQGTLCYESEKLDGESITFYYKEGVFGVCSKEVDFLESETSVHWKMAKELNMEENLKTISKMFGDGDFSMQGEIIGEGIKKNKYKIKGQRVYFYNIFDIKGYKYFNYLDFTKTVGDLNLYTVPILNDNLTLSNKIEDLVSLSNGRSLLYDTKREGIVITPLVEINDMIGRVIFKVISPDFLLKHNE